MTANGVIKRFSSIYFVLGFLLCVASIDVSKFTRKDQSEVFLFYLLTRREGYNPAVIRKSFKCSLTTRSYSPVSLNKE